MAGEPLGYIYKLVRRCIYILRVACLMNFYTFVCAILNNL
mgnify:CR=1 FL=1